MEKSHPSRRKTVAVVGTGMAGLATAHLLHQDPQKRYQVTLIEKVGLSHFWTSCHPVFSVLWCLEEFTRLTRSTERPNIVECGVHSDPLIRPEWSISMGRRAHARLCGWLLSEPRPHV